jgi:MoaA/NifB/PqqE/SkfB family radical SAM enzyme
MKKYHARNNINVKTTMQPINVQELSKTKHFCIAPFVHTMIDTNNNCRLCCANEKPVASLNDVDFTQAWTSDAYKKIRTDMLNDIPVSGCEECYNIEAAGNVSDRTRFNQKPITNVIYKQINLELVSVEHGNRSEKPISYDIRASNLCNLKCVMCGPVSSSEYAKEVNENSVLYNYPNLPRTITPHTEIKLKLNWFDEVEQSILSTDKPILKLLGGEPSIIPAYLNLLEKMLENNNHNGQLYITTNLTNVNKKFKNIIENFKNTVISCSVDGIGSTLEYIRYPINYKKWEENFNYLLKVSNETDNELAYDAHTVVQPYNLYHLPEFIRYITASTVGNTKFKGLSFTAVHDYADSKPLAFNVIPYQDRLVIAEELMELSKDIDPIILKNSRLNYIINLITDNSQPEVVDKTALLVYTLKRDISRGINIKDYIPEVYKLFEDQYETTKLKMLKFSKQNPTI